MNINLRKDALAKLKKEAQIEKKAQDAIGAAENAGPDEDYGHKIFQELLNNLEIEGFEDLD